MKITFSLIAAILISSASHAQDALEIIRKSEQNLRGASSKGTIEMKIVRPSYTRTMVLKTWNQGTEYSMVLVTSPSRDKGTTFLKREKEIWNWIPSVERTVKLPPSMMSQNWMGSDFTNDDLVRESSMITDYTHSLEGEETIDSYPSWKLELTPKPDAAVVWGKVITYISKDKYLQLKTEFYDEYGDLVITLRGMDIKTLGGRTLPGTLEMVPADKDGNKTIMTYKELEFDVSFDEGFFTTQNMKRLR